MSFIDTALTYAADFVLFGGIAYFSIAFLCFAWNQASQSTASVSETKN